MDNLILDVCDISKVYNQNKPNEIQVLNDVSLSIASGEMVSLVAPSGAGKSTLLHICGLLDTSDSGSVHIMGQDTLSLDDLGRTRLRRQEVGFVYQFHHLLPEFTAVENIVLPQLANAVADKDATKWAMQLLDQVGLADRATHRPGELSGGEQQRVAICRALANKPKLLLADEPTGNLDPETAEMVLQHLIDLSRDTQLSALIATHNFDLARRMDRSLELTSTGLVSFQ